MDTPRTGDQGSHQRVHFSLSSEGRKVHWRDPRKIEGLPSNFPDFREEHGNEAFNVLAVRTVDPGIRRGVGCQTMLLLELSPCALEETIVGGQWKWISGLLLE